MKYFISLFLLVFFCTYSNAQKNQPADTSNNKFKTEGIAVTPSSLKFSVKPGSAETKEIKITNDSKKSYKFQIGFSDFMMGKTGKPQAVKPGESKYALSKWISVSPSYFELKPGAVQKITVNVSIPGVDSAFIAAWTILTIDQVTERKPLDASAKASSIALGITPSFGFGVYIYQNPPNVKVNSVEIQKFMYKDTLKAKSLAMEVKNTGDGIGFCTSYAKITNLSTGKQTRLQVKQFTILPGFYRDFFYDLPADLPKGKYSAVGVVDFGNNSEIQAAELNFIIP